MEVRTCSRSGGRIVGSKTLSAGTTRSQRAVLDSGHLRHDADIQTVNVRKAHFYSSDGLEIDHRDSYKFNIAAYELAKLLDIHTVPASVKRRVNRRPSAVTWWIDDVLMIELDRHKYGTKPPDRSAWLRQMQRVFVLDELIYNTDRNRSNLVSRLQRIDPHLLAKLRTLDRDTVSGRMRDYLTRSALDAQLAR
ncbi:MAG: hypothetical protein ACK5AZ_15140 [Bryobacteraceae bacterium]